jgi:hypothetical protein
LTASPMPWPKLPSITTERVAIQLDIGLKA